MEPDRLKSIPLFQTVSDEDLSQIAPFADEVRVEAGKELVREGDFSYEFFAIEEGEAEVTRGGEHVADLGPGDFFGEIALLEPQRRTATVTATTPVTAIAMHARDFHAMAETMPVVYERVRAAMRERLAR